MLFSPEACFISGKDICLIIQRIKDRSLEQDILS